ncbi:MAG: hypothetical protein Q7U34_08575 [Anaerolineales bacterium]|nr:hypothetical protein [Anaerolineales bacterium]
MRPTRFLPKAYSVDRFKVHPAFLPLPANLCHPSISVRAEGLLGCTSPLSAAMPPKAYSADGQLTRLPSPLGLRQIASEHRFGRCAAPTR